VPPAEEEAAEADPPSAARQQGMPRPVFRAEPHPHMSEALPPQFGPGSEPPPPVARAWRQSPQGDCHC
jgi:hypothetical protein